MEITHRDPHAEPDRRLTAAVAEVHRRHRLAEQRATGWLPSGRRAPGSTPTAP